MTVQRVYSGGTYLSGCVFVVSVTHPDRVPQTKALRSVYIGPSSAVTGHRTAPRPSSGELNGMKEVTPQMVAYISVQVTSHYLIVSRTHSCDF